MRSASNMTVRIALAAYIACFGIGAVNHARDFLIYGWRPYAWGPPILEAFWSLLIIFDSLVIALIVFGRRRLGLSLAVFTMVTDVAVNTYAWKTLAFEGFASAVPLQAAFLGYVLGSAPFLWRTKSASTFKDMSSPA